MKKSKAPHTMAVELTAEVLDRNTEEVLETHEFKYPQSDKNTIITKVYDKAGNLKDSTTNPFRSFCKQWLQALYKLFDNETFDSVNLDGTSQNYGLNGFMLHAVEAAPYKSILVGTGTTPVTYEDYDLDTRILHGTTANRLEYGPSYVGHVTSDVSTTSIRIIRTFTNNSGGTITVREVGLASSFNTWENPGSFYCYLLARDVLSIPITVADGETLSAEYYLYFDNTSGFTENLFKALANMFRDTSNWETLTAYDGSTYTSDSTGLLRLDADWEEGTYGLIVGSGVNGIDYQDYSLQAKLDQGTGANQLTHFHSVVEDDLIDDGDEHFVGISRVFANDSGGDIYLRETGLYGAGGGASTRLMFLRTELPTEMLIEDTSVVRFKYRIKLTA